MTDTMNAHDRAISNAVIDLTHAITEICDYLYWLRIDSPEDQANLRELKTLYGILRST